MHSASVIVCSGSQVWQVCAPAVGRSVFSHAVGKHGLVYLLLLCKICRNLARPRAVSRQKMPTWVGRRRTDATTASVSAQKGSLMAPECRWLASKGQLADARRELRKLRAEAETEQALAELADEVAAEAARQGSVWDMLRSRAVRAELTVGAYL